MKIYSLFLVVVVFNFPTFGQKQPKPVSFEKLQGRASRTQSSVNPIIVSYNKALNESFISVSTLNIPDGNELNVPAQLRLNVFNSNFTITSRFSFIGRTLDKDIDEFTISILATGWEILETQNLFIASGKIKLDLGLGKTLSKEGAKMVKNSTKAQVFMYTINRQDLKAVIKAGNVKFVAGGRSLEILNSCKQAFNNILEFGTLQ